MAGHDDGRTAYPRYQAATVALPLCLVTAVVNVAAGLMLVEAGTALLAVSLASCLVPLLLGGRIDGRLRGVLLAFGALFSVYALSSWSNPDASAFRHTVLILLIAIYVTTLYQYGDALARSIGFRILLAGAAVLLVVRMIGMHDLIGRLHGGFRVPQVDWVELRAITTALNQIVLLSACVALRWRAAPGWMVVCALAVSMFLISYASDYRTTMGAAIALIPSYLWFRYTRRIAPWLAHVPLIAMFLLALVATGYFFIAAYVPSSLDPVDQEFVRLTGRGASSGREVIWPISMDLIMARPWSGYGAGTALRDISPVPKTPHSQYLEVTLQTGVAGLAAFLVVLVTIWRLLDRQADPVLRALGLTVMMIVLLENTFNNWLLQSALSLGVLSWLILGVCMAPPGTRNHGRALPGSAAAVGGSQPQG